MKPPTALAQASALLNAMPITDGGPASAASIVGAVNVPKSKMVGAADRIAMPF